ncbi:hypothetical protein ES702_04237 [subsurface metagenome]
MIIFWTECTHHAQSIRPIYEEMKRRGKDVTWAVTRRPPKIGNIVTASAQVAWAYGRPHNRTISLNHSLDRHELTKDYPVSRRFKAVMFPGVWWQKRMKNPPRNRVVGWPKSDILFNVDVQKLRREIGLPEGKTIFYAASYTYWSRKVTEAVIINAKILCKLARELGFNVLVKVHPGMLDVNFRLLSNVLQIQKNTYVLPRYSGNSMKAFPLADVFVSETSGMLTEFLATGKPSIQTSTSVKHRAPGGVFHAKVGHIAPILQLLQPHPDALKWKNLLMNTVDGKASVRAANFIEEVFG